jgi:hypothetical protein
MEIKIKFILAEDGQLTKIINLPECKDEKLSDV